VVLDPWAFSPRTRIGGLRPVSNSSAAVKPLPLRALYSIRARFAYSLLNAGRERLLVAIENDQASSMMAAVINGSLMAESRSSCYGTRERISHGEQGLKSGGNFGGNCEDISTS
jgi:hypothetical protein